MSRDLVYCESCKTYQGYKRDWNFKRKKCKYCTGEKEKHPFAERLGY